MSPRSALASLAARLSPSTICALTLLVCAIVLQLLLIRSVASDPLTAMAPATTTHTSATPSQTMIQHVLRAADTGGSTYTITL